MCSTREVPPDDVLERFGELAAAVAGGKRQADLHAVALRRAHAGGEPLLCEPRFRTSRCERPGAHIVRAVMEGVRVQHALADGRGRIIHRAPVRRASIHRRRREVGALVSDLCGCIEPSDRPKSRIRFRRTFGARRSWPPVGLGKLKVEDIAALVPIEKRYMPNQDHQSIYDELFKAFLEIQKNNEAMYNRLNS